MGKGEGKELEKVCEGGEVARWGRWEGNEVMGWEIPGFI